MQRRASTAECEGGRRDGEVRWGEAPPIIRQVSCSCCCHPRTCAVSRLVPVPCWAPALILGYHGDTMGRPWGYHGDAAATMCTEETQIQTQPAAMWWSCHLLCSKEILLLYFGDVWSTTTPTWARLYSTQTSVWKLLWKRLAEARRSNAKQLLYGRLRAFFRLWSVVLHVLWVLWHSAAASCPKLMQRRRDDVVRCYWALNPHYRGRIPSRPVGSFHKRLRTYSYCRVNRGSAKTIFVSAQTPRLPLFLMALF